MSTLAWIVAGGLAMAAISLVGSVTLLLDEATQRRLTPPLVAFAARKAPYVSGLARFSLFLAIEQLLHWHHCHRETADCHPPLVYLAGAGFLAALKLALGD